MLLLSAGLMLNEPSVAVVFIASLKVMLIVALVEGAGGPLVWPAVSAGDTLLT